MNDYSKDRERKVTYYPATKSVTYIDKQMFATIICMIPKGKLTTLEAICDMWAKRKGVDRCELGSAGILPLSKKLFWRPTDIQRVDFITDLSDSSAEDDDMIPYWRIISQRGMLMDYGQFSSKETQKVRLEREGHTIVQPNPDKRLYRVQNYKNALFDLDRLTIKE